MNMRNKLMSKSQHSDYDWMGALFVTFPLPVTFCLLRRESEQVCERERKPERREDRGGRRKGKPKPAILKKYGLGQ